MPREGGYAKPASHARRLLPGMRARDETRMQAFADLYEQQFDRIYAFLRYRLDDAQLAEDLAAEVFSRAWTKLPDPRILDSAIAWLFTTARRLVADHYRSRRPGLTLQQALPTSRATAELPETRLLADEHLAGVARCLAGLSEREREIMGLRFVAELRNRQIAHVLGMSEGNVAKIIHRALARVRDRLQKEGLDV